MNDEVTEGLATKDRMRRAYYDWFNVEHEGCECFEFDRRPRCTYRMCKDNPHLNYYCPTCHEVACGMRRQGEWIVLPHYRNDVEALVKSQRAPVFGRPCRGGPVDRVKDRAP